jgi:hypothetical protein
MTKTITKKILKIRQDMARLEKIISELKGNELMKNQLYEFTLKYHELGIVLNFLERWDEM